MISSNLQPTSTAPDSALAAAVLALLVASYRCGQRNGVLLAAERVDSIDDAWWRALLAELASEPPPAPPHRGC